MVVAHDSVRTYMLLFFSCERACYHSRVYKPRKPAPFFEGMSWLGFCTHVLRVPANPFQNVRVIFRFGIFGFVGISGRRQQPSQRGSLNIKVWQGPIEQVFEHSSSVFCLRMTWNIRLLPANLDTLRTCPVIRLFQCSTGVWCYILPQVHITQLILSDCV